MATKTGEAERLGVLCFNGEALRLEAMLEHLKRTKQLSRVINRTLQGLGGQLAAPPLHVAIAKGHIETVRVLLEYGADPNLKDPQGWTPLHWALHVASSITIVHMLLEGGARMRELPANLKSLSSFLLWPFTRPKLRYVTVPTLFTWGAVLFLLELAP